MLNDLKKKSQSIHRRNSRLINWINTAAPNMTLGFRSLKALYFVLHNLGIMNFWLSFSLNFKFMTCFLIGFREPSRIVMKNSFSFHLKFMTQFAMFSHLFSFFQLRLCLWFMNVRWKRALSHLLLVEIGDKSRAESESFMIILHVFPRNFSTAHDHDSKLVFLSYKKNVLLVIICVFSLFFLISTWNNREVYDKKTFNRIFLQIFRLCRKSFHDA